MNIHIKDDEFTDNVVLSSNVTPEVSQPTTPTTSPQDPQGDIGVGHARPSSLEMFDLLTKLQSSRLDDQRCLMPTSPQAQQSQSNIQQQYTQLRTEAKNRLQEVLKFPPPYPMIVLPKMGFWMEPPTGMDASTLRRNVAPSKFECEEFARIYRNHFLNSEHFNFRAYDDVLGPLVLSLKLCDDSDQGQQENGSLDSNKSVQLIARLNSGSLHKYIHSTELGVTGELVPSRLAKFIVPDLSTDQFEPVLCPQASELIMQYDEHSIVNTFKFGLIYQKVGQVTEESMFGNRTHSPAMEEFMNWIGRIIPLAEHQGYRGGLDTKHGQTGKYSLYETFHGNEIMFHVSTFLPYVDSDPQHLQRKCHIGNDIVAIVFQDGNTPFTPDMIISHFLHAFILVQPVDNHGQGTTRYKVSVTAKSDVPHFGPSFPGGSNIVRKGAELKEFLLTKLMNAETACYRAEKFSKLEQRTRISLLANLDQMLTEKTREFLGVDSNAGGSGKLETDRRQSSSKIIESVKRALSSKNKNSSNASDSSYHHAKVVKSKSTMIPFGANQREGGLTLPPNGGDIPDYNVYRGSVSPARLFGDNDSGRGSIETEHLHLQRATTLLSPQLIGRPILPSSSRASANAASESDDSSLNSTEDNHTALHRKATLATGVVRSEYYDVGPAGFHNVISGAVTTVPIEGQSASAIQEERLRDEVTKLKGEKLELLRQNVSYQRELKRLREREVQLQSDLTTASREIVRLRMREKDNNNLPGRQTSPINGYQPSNGQSMNKDKSQETSPQRLF